MNRLNVLLCHQSKYSLLKEDNKASAHVLSIAMEMQETN